MQVPPMYWRSIIAVFHPAFAKATASGLPPWPVPMTMASYCFGSGIVASGASETRLLARKDFLKTRSLPDYQRMRAALQYPAHDLSVLIVLSQPAQQQTRAFARN